MKHISQVAKKISGLDLSPTMKDMATEIEIRNFTEEFARICKNIRETSAGIEDRGDRVISLAEESGIHVQIVNKLC